MNLLTKTFTRTASQGLTDMTFFKNLTLILIFASLFLTPEFGQTATATITNVGVSGGTFSFDIQLQPTDDWGSSGNNRALGDASWVFDLNTTALSTPVITTAGGPVDSDSGYTNSIAVSGSKLIVTTEFDGVGSGVKLAPSSTHLLYSVSLTITDPFANSSLAWDALNTGVFNAPDAIVTVSYSGDGDTSLPVSLSTFTAGVSEGGVLLEWTTESEVNNQGFEVHRADSEDGPFQLIASYSQNPLLAGAGNSNEQQQYRFYDALVLDGQRYFYQIADVSTDGQRHFHGPVAVFTGDGALASTFELYQNFPNPFNPETTIRFDLPPSAGYGSEVRVAIFNMLGQLVRTLQNGPLDPGRHVLVWDGRNEAGAQVASGTYVLSFSHRDFHDTKKMILLK